MFDLDTNTLRNVLFTLMPLFGLYRLAKTYRERKLTELPRGSALNEAWIRAEVKRGHRPRAIQAWRALYGSSSAEARAAIDTIDRELRGLPAQSHEPSTTDSP